MRLDYGAILFALATTAAAAPMPGQNGSQHKAQHEERFKWAIPRPRIPIPGNIPPLAGHLPHGHLPPSLDLTSYQPKDEANSQHGKRTYLVPEVQTYRLDHGRLIMDEAHRVKEPQPAATAQHDQRSYLVPDQTKGTYRLDNGRLIPDEAHRVPDPQPAVGDAEAHAQDAISETMEIMDKHGKRFLMPSFGPGLGLPKYDEYDGHNHYEQPKPKPKPKSQPKPVSDPFRTFNKHEERSYLVPEVQTYRTENGHLIMDEAHRVHNNPDPADNPYNMTVKPLPHHKRESDAQLVERGMFGDIMEQLRGFGHIHDIIAQHNQEQKNGKRETNEQLEERKLHSRHAVLPDLPVKHEVYPAWQRIPAQESGDQHGPKFDLGQIQMLRQHEERAQIHGTYGIPDSVVESPRLRYPPPRHPKYPHYDNKKDFLEERTYLVPNVRTYRLDHGRLIMDEAHRVPDTEPSQPQNQRRSDIYDDIEARRLAPWLQEQIIERYRQQHAQTAGTQHAHQGPRYPKYMKGDETDTHVARRDNALSQDELAALNAELESQLAKRILLLPDHDLKRPKPTATATQYRPDATPSTPPLRYNWNGKANFQPFRDGWHHGHPPWFLGVQSQKQGGGDFQDKRDTLNSELDALEARRFMLPPLGSHPRPHGPKPKWPSAGTHGVPGAVPGAAGSPHSDSHNDGKHPWWQSDAVIAKRDDTARVNAAIDEWAQSAHTDPKAWADNAENVLKAAFPGIRISRTDKPKDKRKLPKSDRKPKASLKPSGARPELTPEECRIRQQEIEQEQAKHPKAKVGGLPLSCWRLYKRDEDTADSTAEGGPKDGSDRNSSPETTETSENDHEGSTGNTDSASGDDSAAVYASDSGSSSVTGSTLPTSTSSVASHPAATDEATKKALDAVCALVTSLAGGRQTSGQVQGLISLCEKIKNASGGSTSTGSAAAHITSSADSVSSEDTETSSGSGSSTASGSSSASDGDTSSATSSSASGSASGISSTSTGDDASPTDEE